LNPVIAVDLGASSGRIIEVSLEDSFRANEVHRFPNQPIYRRRHLRWNIQRLWSEVIRSIESVLGEASSVGICTWGVDYGLLDGEGNLLEEPIHYRDERTEGVMEWVFERVPKEEIFLRTGVQFLKLNTIYQLASMVRGRSRVIRRAETYLGIPDILNYWLTGAKNSEFTHASTTQLLDPRERDWCYDIILSIGLPEKIFPEIIEPGTKLGDLKGVPVCASACHDTGSAVVAVPTRDQEFVYISSGTWSLLGTEIKRPLINEKVYKLNFTNEGGAGGTIRLLKNLPGLWLEQELMREWTGKGATVTYSDLQEAAENTPAFISLIDPNDPVFIKPGDMTGRIQDYCRKTGQPAPMSIGEHMRCVYESLALNYRTVLRQLKDITGTGYKRLNIIGGGSRNRVLSQMTADSTNCRVETGPAEAAALGNAVVQYVSLGALDDIKDARGVLAESEWVKTFYPLEPESWDEAYERFLRLGI
jgi:sugar (pentulose or hexulose) kinase